MALALANTETILNQKNESMAQYTHANKGLIRELLDQLKKLNFIGVSVSAPK